MEYINITPEEFAVLTKEGDDDLREFAEKIPISTERFEELRKQAAILSIRTIYQYREVLYLLLRNEEATLRVWQYFDK